MLARDRVFVEAERRPCLSSTRVRRLFTSFGCKGRKYGVRLSLQSCDVFVPELKRGRSSGVVDEGMAMATVVSYAMLPD